MRFIIPIFPMIHRIPMNHFIVKIKYQARFPGIRLSEPPSSHSPLEHQGFIVESLVALRISFIPPMAP
jgi:hypothetical protein